MTGGPKGDEKTVDIGALLTIDVDAELRKLATAQLQGPWQIPAELVRRSMAAGASRVDVSFSRRRVRVEDDGRVIDASQVQALAELLNPEGSARSRHAALLSLEAVGAVPLLALAGLSLTSLTLESSGEGGSRVRLVVRRGKPPSLSREARREGDSSGGTRIELVAETLEVKRAREWLEEVGRFAGAALRVDGEAGPDGLRDYLVSAPVEIPFGERSVRGRIGIPHSGDTPRLWILQHGIVVTHQGLTKAPTFEALLELGSQVAPRATAADLRELVAPTLVPLSEEAVTLMLRAARRLPEMGAEGQSRLIRLLLQAARLGRKRREIEGARLVPCLVGHDEAPVWRSIAELRGTNGGARAAIPAIYPGRPTDEVILGGVPVAVLGSSARSAITELFGLRFGPAPRQVGQSGRGRWSADLLDRLSDLSGSIAAALHLGIGPPLEDSALSPAELRLVEHLRAVIPSGGAEAPQEVFLCRGRGRIRQTRGEPRRLLLPRDNPDVRACVGAIAEDAAWIYPASVVLLGGRGLPSVGARATWQRGWGG